MNVDNIEKFEDGSATLEVNLTAEELNYVYTVGMGTLLALGAQKKSEIESGKATTSN